MPLGMPEDGEGGVTGGVYGRQLLQRLTVLLQPLHRGLQAVWEGQWGQRGCQGQFGLWEKWRKKLGQKYKNYISRQENKMKTYFLVYQKNVKSQNRNNAKTNKKSVFISVID